MFVGLVKYFCSYQIVTKLDILKRFSKNNQITNFTKILPVGAELFTHPDRRTDRETDVTKLIIAFRCFANATKQTTVLSFSGIEARPCDLSSQ